MEEKLGINETLQVLDGAKELAVFAATILKDGKVNLADLPALVELAKKFDVFKDAVTGAEKVLAEAKDVDATEATVLVAKVFEIVAAIKAAKA
jgi:UDP-N-acetylglucosamine enolpyruvyl transferase